MSKLWVFGDSNSTLSSHENLQSIDGFRCYTDKLGYMHKNYTEIIADNLNLELNNRGEAGSCNLDILRRITDELENISQEDYVIINFTDHARFPLTFKDNNGRYDIAIPSRDYDNEDVSNYLLSANSIKENLVNRDSLVYVEEIEILIKLIKKSIKSDKLFIWSFEPSLSDIDGVINLIRACSYYSTGNLTNISQETNNECVDGHLGEQGNRALAKLLELFIQETDQDVLDHILLIAPNDLLMPQTGNETN